MNDQRENMKALRQAAEAQTQATWAVAWAVALGFGFILDPGALAAAKSLVYVALAIGLVIGLAWALGRLIGWACRSAPAQAIGHAVATSYRWLASTYPARILARLHAWCDTRNARRERVLHRIGYGIVATAVLANGLVLIFGAMK